jgi:hypothetical protein
MKGTGRRVLTVVLILGVVLLLAGCDFFAGIFNPLIGKWQMSELIGPDVTMAQTLEMHGDKTWSMTGVISGAASGSTSGTGTYTQEETTLAISGTYTMVVVGEGTNSIILPAAPVTYSISGNTMTWTDTTGVLTQEPGTVLTWTRQ